MLQLQNLKASVNDKSILNGLNLKINSGEVHAIMGPNGSGKHISKYIVWKKWLPSKWKFKKYEGKIFKKFQLRREHKKVFS